MVIPNDQLGSQKVQDSDDTDKNSNIFVWGDNTNGQLSLTAETRLVCDPIAVRLASVRQIKAVACGKAHTLFISGTDGLVYAMGDNTYGQLAIPQSQLSSSMQPCLVSIQGLKSEMVATHVECGQNSSFVSYQATLGDELYSWGCPEGGVLGHQSPQSETPSKVEFDSDNVLKIDHFSVGKTHGALVTKDGAVFFWGDNTKGQLGLGDVECRTGPTLNTSIERHSSCLPIVSCGDEFSFLISGMNEIMISGKLPFMVQNDDQQEQDFIVTFQSIAQFDQRVQITQVETSRFASIVVDPREDDQPKELFLWGKSPLGIFNELTPLNQLFSNCYEQTGEHGQTFNVSAVRNGLNFCVFVDDLTGMTYQIGAENMIDPYVDDALVSLSELRDAQFGNLAQFACGERFVIGQSTVPGTLMSCSPMKKVNCDMRQMSPSKMASPIKEVVQEDNITESMNNQLVSPDCSKQSFPQRALFQGSISPSTPTENQSICSFSDNKSMKFRCKDIMGTFKPVIMQNSKPSSPIKQQSALNNHDRAKSCFEIQDSLSATKLTPQATQIVSVLSKKESTDFNKTAMHNFKPSASEILIDGDKPSDSTTVYNLLLEPAEPEQTKPIIEEESKFQTSNKPKRDRPLFSPEVSPIGGGQDNTLRDSVIADQNWITNCSGYPTMSCEKQLQEVKNKEIEKRLMEESFHKSLKSMISSQLPLQMQGNSHMIYQNYPSTAMVRSPEPQHAGLARYLPVQQQQTSLQSTPRQQQQSSQQHMMTGYMTAQQQQQTQMLNQSQVLNQSGYLNMSQHQQQLADQQSFYELMMKEKLETAQLRGQLQESQRQLEKSRKDYSKLLSQVDEDQEETAALKEKTRKQEATLTEMGIQARDMEAALSKAGSEKAKLETEVKQQSKEYVNVQAEFTQLQAKMKELASRSEGHCQNQSCKKHVQDLETQIQTKAKQMYDLTVKLGCIELENKELAVQVKSYSLTYQTKINDQHIMAEQAQQIQELQEALQRPDSLDQAIQTETGDVDHKYIQVQLSEEEFPRFSHSVQKTVPTQEVIQMDLPAAIYEAVPDSVREAEIDDSLQISMSLHQHSSQDESSHCCESLKEFRSIERATKTSTIPQRQSMELPRQITGSLMQRISSTKKNFQTHQSGVTERSDSRPKHNFVGNTSTVSNREPRILRKSEQRGSCKQLGIGTKTESENGAATAHQIMCVDSRTNRASMDPNTSLTTYQNDGRKECPQENQSLINFGDQSVDADQSWQTFKPMTTCPNDRYSLKRHQEIFMESQMSHKDDSEGMEGSSFGINQSSAACGGAKTERRAKSNSEAGALQIGSQQKVRRLRHQRKAAQANGDKATGYDETTVKDDTTSQRSIGAKSNMTTPAMTERSNHKQQISNSKGRNSMSGLKAPTHMTKSPALRATLSKIDSQSQLRTHQQQAPMTSRNSVPKTFQPSQTPRNGAGYDFFQNGSTSRQSISNLRNSSHSNLTQAQGGNTSRLNRPQTTRVSHLDQYQTATYSQSQANLTSATPRVKSLNMLHGNAPNLLGRQSTKSKTKQSQDNKQSAIASAAARRVAYDHRRKLAFQSMKQMTRQNQTHSSEINRQARQACLAQATQQVDSALLTVEEPFEHPPEQTQKPEMSVQEESMILSARNGAKMGNMSMQSTMNLTHGDTNTPLNMTLSSVQQQQNPFLVVPNGTQTMSSQNKAKQSMTTRNTKSARLISHNSSGVSQSMPSVKDSAEASDESSHLVEMKDKLHQIQSNKLLLEQKINEYESKLKEISQEKSTQEIWANAKKNQQPHHKRRGSRSTENYLSGEDISDYTLGDTSKISNGDKQTPRHIFTTQDRHNRRAFQQLNGQSNNATPTTQPQQLYPSTTSKSGGYRNCYIAPPSLPQNRIKAGPTVAAKTHYVNQTIFRQ